jgi:hypothetical protein
LALAAAALPLLLLVVTARLLACTSARPGASLWRLVAQALLALRTTSAVHLAVALAVVSMPAIQHLVVALVGWALCIHQLPQAHLPGVRAARLARLT